MVPAMKLETDGNMQVIATTCRSHDLDEDLSKASLVATIVIYPKQEFDHLGWGSSSRNFWQPLLPDNLERFGRLAIHLSSSAENSLKSLLATSR